MRAELKALHSPDVPDLEGWLPEDPAHFGFLLQVLIGPAGESGTESFDVQICTPSWFGERLCSDRPVSGEHTLFMVRWDHGALVGYIERYVRRCEGASWDEIAQQLSHLGRWEFKDYRPFGSHQHEYP